MELAVSVKAVDGAVSRGAHETGAHVKGIIMKSFGEAESGVVTLSGRDGEARTGQIVHLGRHRQHKLGSAGIGGQQIIQFRGRAGLRSRRVRRIPEAEVAGPEPAIG